jgi:sulfatase modifying factor 1
MRHRWASLAAILLPALLAGCLVKSKCFRDEDCNAPKICGGSGTCVYECTAREDCQEGFECVDRRCTPEQVPQIQCPADMAAVANGFCMDLYEASRPDATDLQEGEGEAQAFSRAGVLPWTVSSNAEAQRACNEAGKRLCTATEWAFACKGTRGTSYVYGDVYDPDICNGIDTFGTDAYRITPAGAFPDCRNEWGIFDLCGNMWEHVKGGTSTTVRGGSYKSPDPMEDHRCDYTPATWIPCACSLGFRCCLTPGAGPDEEEPAAEPEAVEPEPEREDAVEPVEEDAAEDEAEGDAPLPCPSDMVLAGAACIDRFEVSRSDATATDHGTVDVPVVRAGVLPWDGVTLEAARSACASVDKHLCTPEEWEDACGGAAASTYTYGDAYEPTTCNGPDAFCLCDAPLCADLDTCPYPGCFTRPSPEGGGPCGSDPRVAPTGGFPECVNDFGAYDMSGNSFEIVDAGDGSDLFMGGAYDSVDSAAQHACSFATDGLALCPCSKGFRCCKEPL